MEILQEQVYATQPGPLQKQIESLLAESSQSPLEDEILALIVPDTNLLRTGSVSADVFKTIAGHNYETVILVSPSHMGSFGRITICDLKQYQTPLGSIPINTRICHELCDEDDDIFLDDTGHFHTRGIEVQLPFLQNVLSDFNAVPIVMGTETPDFCRELGAAIGAIMFNSKTLLVATADIQSAESNDLDTFQEALEQGNVDALFPLLYSNKVDVLGKGALLVAMIASLRRRAKRFQVLSLGAPDDRTPGHIGAIITR